MNTSTTLPRANRFRGSRLAVVLAILVVTAAIGISAWLVISRATSEPTALPFTESAMDWVGPNGSLAKLIGESDIIVVGRVTRITGSDRVYPITYDPSDGHLPEGIDPGITFTHLEVTVDEYLLGDGPATLTMRQAGDLEKTNGTREFPKPAFGEPMILFLTAEPERGANTYASNRGPFGRVSAHGGSIYYAWGDGPREVPWAAGMTLDEAAAEVRTSVE